MLNTDLEQLTLEGAVILIFKSVARSGSFPITHFWATFTFIQLLDRLLHSSWHSVLKHGCKKSRANFRKKEDIEDGSR